MNLFWSKGYEHTSMQDLLTVMNLSKSSLYQAFGGKQRLFLRCLARYTDQFAERLYQGLAAAPSGHRFIEEFLYSVLADADGTLAPRGCLVMNTACEFAQREPDIARDVAISVGRFRGALQAAVERAQHEGDIAPDKDSRELAAFLVSSMSGLKVQAKAGTDTVTLKSIIALVLRALD